MAMYMLLKQVVGKYFPGDLYAPPRAAYREYFVSASVSLDWRPGGLDIKVLRNNTLRAVI